MLFRERKLSRIRAFQIFKVINYRENSQNSRKPRKFLLAKVSTPKVHINDKKNFTLTMPLIISKNFTDWRISWLFSKIILKPKIKNVLKTKHLSSSYDKSTFMTKVLYPSWSLEIWAWNGSFQSNSSSSPN